LPIFLCRKQLGSKQCTTSAMHYIITLNLILKW